MNMCMLLECIFVLLKFFLGDQTIITAGSDNQVVSHIFKAEDQDSSSN